MLRQGSCMLLPPHSESYNKDHLENQKPGDISIPLDSMEHSSHNSPGDSTSISLCERPFSSFVLFYSSVTLMAAFPRES